MVRVILTLTSFLLYYVLSIALSTAQPTSTCSAPEIELTDEPGLQEMKFDLGYGPEYFTSYIQPNITTMTNGNYTVEQRPNMTGIAAKFFNMGNHPVRVYWVPPGNQTPSLIAKCDAFHAVGTASMTDHEFIFVTKDYDPSEEPSQAQYILQHFTIKAGINNYYYDPIDVLDHPEQKARNLERLSLNEQVKYDVMVRNRLFGVKYREFTGRDYLAMYPRNRPSHKLWRADYFGQMHWVMSNATHFVERPSDQELKEISRGSMDMVEEDRLFSKYRTNESDLNMTLTVLSCAPRVFEILNFLSEVEVDHILSYAGESNLKRSTTAGDSETNSGTNKVTRTSRNTWVYRQSDQIVDAIYRRAADVMRIDEALLRQRSEDEYPDLDSKSSLAEALQLVHYDVGQEYTAHHDFGYPKIDDNKQPARFATLLIYLNEDMIGGETEFPRYVNGETEKGLKVSPQKGKAVLFYDQLPDGNYDDLSHHQAHPVKEGRKFLVNLWVWDPVYGA